MSMWGSRTPRRLDQRLIGSTGTGVMLPAPLGGIIRAQYVIVSGTTAAGVFVYAGGYQTLYGTVYPPAEGQPVTPQAGLYPVAWLSAGGTDPYGNSLPGELGAGSGFIEGSVIAPGTITGEQIADLSITASEIANLTITGAQIAELTIDGTKLVTAPKIIVDGTGGGYLQVNGQGTSYVQVQSESATSFARIVFASGASDENTPGQIISAVETLYNELFIQGPSVDTYTDWAAVSLNSQNSDGSSNANGALNVSGGAPLTWDKTGVTVTALQDGNTYRAGQLTEQLSSAVTITSTSGNQIFPSLDTAPGQYKYEMFLHCLMGSASVAPGVDIGFSGTFAGGAGMLESSTYGESTGEEIYLYPLTASTLSNELPAYTANVNFWIRATGTMTFSSTGAIAPFGYVGTSGDSWVIAEGSFFTLTPVSTTT